MPFTDHHGKERAHARESVCPIGEFLGGNKWRFSGTAFCIASEGIYLTAAHNFLKRGAAVLTEAASAIRTPVLVRTLPVDKKSVRIEMSQVKQVVMLTDRLDIAICQVSTGELRPMMLKLSASWPKEGDQVYAYACPNTPGNVDNVTGKLDINHTDYAAHVTDCFPNGRDRTFLPRACFEMDFDAPGGASGGPVFNAAGHVIGVISTSMGGDPPRSYATPIGPILDTSFEIQTDQGLKEISLRDLGKLRKVSIVD